MKGWNEGKVEGGREGGEGGEGRREGGREGGRYLRGMTDGEASIYGSVLNLLCMSSSLIETIL